MQQIYELVFRPSKQNEQNSAAKPPNLENLVAEEASKNEPAALRRQKITSK